MANRDTAFHHHRGEPEARIPADVVSRRRVLPTKVRRVDPTTKSVISVSKQKKTHNNYFFYDLK